MVHSVWRRIGAVEYEPAWPRAQPVVLAASLTAVGAVVWAVFLTHVGTDLSAQIARARFAGAYPGAAYNFSWYGGIAPAGYSILAPYIFAILGTRQATSIAGVVSAGLLGLLLVRHQVPRPRAAVLWAVVAVWTGLLAGQATFTLGLSAALGCVAVVDTASHIRSARWMTAAVLAALSSLCSPVAGLFLGVAAAAFVLIGRRAAGIVVGTAAGVPLAISAYFSAGGVQPIGATNALPSVVGAIFVVVGVPKQWRAIRIGAAIYGLAAVIAWFVPTPVGSNVERLGLVLAGPLLAGTGMTGTRTARRLLALALCGVAIWQLASPVRDIANGSAPPMHDEATVAVQHELRALHADTGRVEAIPEFGHWESTELAGTVQLARGWERQIDTARNPIFYRSGLTPAAYHNWLRTNAVGYVVRSTSTKPDYAAVAETAIVRSGQPWLTPIWHNASWEIYRVVGSKPLVDAPATVISAAPAAITITMSRAGSTLIRVYYSPMLRVNGPARLDRDGNWVRLTTNAPGTYVLHGSY